VLEGTLIFRFMDKEIEAPAGTTVFIPAGVPHDYYEASGPARYLIIMPPRLRALVNALHAASPEQHGEVLRTYDSETIP
jgi:quercetin dioxygenase-like cupin family protein